MFRCEKLGCQYQHLLKIEVSNWKKAFETPFKNLQNTGTQMKDDILADVGYLVKKHNWEVQFSSVAKQTLRQSASRLIFGVLTAAT